MLIQVQPVFYSDQLNIHTRPYSLAESKGNSVSLRNNVKTQTNLNRKGIIVTKTNILGVEAQPG